MKEISTNWRGGENMDPEEMAKKDGNGQEEAETPLYSGSRFMAIEEVCKELRGQCKDTEQSVRELMVHPVFKNEQKYLNQHGEMKAQIMLAVRHLEDARMRLGKVCQYASDGISIFDKM